MQEDRVHQTVQQYLRRHPEVQRDNRVQRAGDAGEGEYIIDGRSVKVGFCREGFLVVHDGPLRQPFDDYVARNETTAIYHEGGLKTTTVNTLPMATRISFGDEGNRYTRLDAMKVAKEQANFREKAAGYAAEGQAVPDDLMRKYEKAIDVKLGTRRRTEAAWAAGQAAAGPSGPTAAPSASVPQQEARLFGNVPDFVGMLKNGRQIPSSPAMSVVMPMPGRPAVPAVPAIPAVPAVPALPMRSAAPAVSTPVLSPVLAATGAPAMMSSMMRQPSCPAFASTSKSVRMPIASTRTVVAR